ncbi:MAG: Mu transposase C-terminal domain-containing protein [Pseudomonadota bacterium]
MGDPSQASRENSLAVQRAEKLRSLLTRQSGDERLEDQVMSIANEAEVDRATVFRWLKRLREGDGRTSALSHKKGGRRSGELQLSEDKHALIEQLLRERYLVRERPSLARVMLDIAAAFEERGWKPPARRTVQRRLDTMDPREVMLKRQGSVEAAKHFAPKVGQHAVTEAMELVQIDHTLADVILVDSVEREALQRPWLTLAIDVATRMIAGVYLSFDRPSSVAVAMCITQMVGDKTKWLAARECALPWPVFGIPKRIGLDNAKEFKSKDLKAACREWGVELDHRPVGAPHYGGHIERLIGTIMGSVHMLPGTTHSSVEENKDYLSQARAVLTLLEFEKWLALEIGRYNHSIHSALKRPPIAVWEEIEERRPFRMPKDMDGFKVDFLPGKFRTLTRSGIRLFSIDYWSDALTPLLGRTAERLLVKYDPRDLSRIWVRHPSGRMLEVRYRNLSRPPISLWEHREASRRLHAQGKSELKEAMIFDAIAEQRAIVSKATKLTKERELSRRLDQGSEPEEDQYKKKEKTSGLTAIDTGDPTQPTFAVEEWD